MKIGDYNSMLAGLHFAPPLNRNYVSQILTWSDEVTPNPDANSSPTSSRALRDWVKEVAVLTRPDAVVWCDGSEAEKNRLTKQAVAAGILIELNQTKRPGCYLHRSNPNDVARTEQLTFVCTPDKIDAGPTNNWSDPAETYAKLRGWLNGSMRGRSMYVVHTCWARWGHRSRRSVSS